MVIIKAFFTSKVQFFILLPLYISLSYSLYYKAVNSSKLHNLQKTRPFFVLKNRRGFFNFS